MLCVADIATPYHTTSCPGRSNGACLRLAWEGAMRPRPDDNGEDGRSDRSYLRIASIGEAPPRPYKQGAVLSVSLEHVFVHEGAGRGYYSPRTIIYNFNICVVHGDQSHSPSLARYSICHIEEYSEIKRINAGQLNANLPPCALTQHQSASMYQSHLHQALRTCGMMPGLPSWQAPCSLASPRKMSIILQTDFIRYRRRTQPTGCFSPRASVPALAWASAKLRLSTSPVNR